VRSGVAAAGNSHARAGLHAGGNAHVNRFGAPHAPLTAAHAAGRAHSSCAAATRAGDVETHFPAGLRHVAGASAGRADLWCAGGARPAAGRATLQVRDGQFFHRAAHRFPETDGNLVLQVRAGLLYLRPRAASAEKLAEQVAETGAATPAEVVSVEVELHPGVFRRRRSPAVRVESKLVVSLALLGIGENVVRFLNLLEFFFRGLVTGIEVGMILARQAAVGLANILLAGLARDSQKVVVILLGGRCHRWFSAPRQ